MAIVKFAFRNAMNIAFLRPSVASPLSISMTKFSSMPDPIEHATGIEKKELLAKLAGNDDPFDMRVIKRGASTKECPTQIPSAFDSRILGCICDEDSSHIQWMWLHQGPPKRCACGHYFQLVYKAPL